MAAPADALWEMVAAERSAMADLGATLTPEQWDAPSLCDGWRVRDVFGHVVFTIESTPGAVFARVVRSGFRIHPMFARAAVEVGNRPTGELVQRLRAGAGKRWSATFPPPRNFVADAVVHHQDVRRPLGLARTVPAERVRVALDAYKDKSQPVGTKRRIVGLRLVATDLDWSHGDGPTVTGTGEQLLMVMAGRMVVVGELGGEGKAALAGRP